MSQPDVQSSRGPGTEIVSQGSHWYVCLTKPRHERVAQGHLEEQGYEVYVPLFSSWQQHSGGWRRTDRVMFPRYAFVRPTQAGQSIAPVRNTPGVSSLVSFGHVLGYVAADKLDALRQLVLERSELGPEHPIEPGKLVVFSSGPLKGLNGLVSSVSSERVTVLMSLLGREKLVATPVNHLSLA